MTERNGQVVFTLNSEIMLPEDAPVRLTNAQLEELDYRKLYAAYSSRGRKSVTDPRVLFKILVYGYQCGIYTTRKMEEACRYWIDFKWLLWDEPVPDHSEITRFRTGQCAEAVEDLFLPVCAVSGGAGRNRSRDRFHRWNETGELCGTVYLCVAEERGQAACQSEGEGSLGSFDHKPGSAGAAACGDGSRYLVCPWPRPQEERHPEAVGGAGRTAPEMAGL